MVRLSRRDNHEQKRPRRLAAPTSLQDPLLNRNFWHDLMYDGGDEDNDHGDGNNQDDDYEDYGLNDDDIDTNVNTNFESPHKGSAPVIRIKRRGPQTGNNRSPVIRINKQRLRQAEPRQKNRREAKTDDDLKVEETGMLVVLKMAPERLNRIRRGLRGQRRKSTIRSSSSSAMAQTNGNSSTSNTYQQQMTQLSSSAQVPPSVVNVEEEIEEIEDSDEEPYRGVLTGEDADTSKTLPTEIDEALFETSLRNARRRGSPPETDGSSQTTHQNVSKIRMIRIGGYEIDTWYTAPYPEEYSRHSVLPLCEFCLKYMSSDYVAWRHRLKCPYKHPPGREIYRYKSNSVFEVDGKKMPLYCQNLCLLAKMFLDSKTLYYDVEPFMFYVLTENDRFGCHFVGYFSKQKAAVVAAAAAAAAAATTATNQGPATLAVPTGLVNTNSSAAYNVSCILTLPTAQRKGYGNFLIDFSYLLTRQEGTTGTPEKPLSNLGLASYTNYWKLALCYQLRNLVESVGDHQVSIAKLSQLTGMTVDDVVVGLEQLEFLAYDPNNGQFSLKINQGVIDATISKWESKGYLRLHPENLLWVPLDNDNVTPPLEERELTEQEIEEESQIDIADVLDSLVTMVPPPYSVPEQQVEHPFQYNRSPKKAIRISSSFLRRRPASMSSHKKSRKSNKSHTDDGLPKRPRGRPKGAIAIKNLAKNLGVTMSEAAKIRERDRLAYKHANIEAYPEYG